MKALSSSKSVTLANETCPYCGSSLLSSSREKDHVIARKFVPTGKLAGSWNLKVRCCRKCNLEKSDLEDDISAITMKLLADRLDDVGALGKELAREVERKARHSKSRLTRKPVRESYGNIEARESLGPGVEFTANLTHPPQIDPERSFKLAEMQVMAFFYWITYDEETKRDASGQVVSSPFPNQRQLVQIGATQHIDGSWMRCLIGIREFVLSQRATSSKSPFVSIPKLRVGHGCLSGIVSTDCLVSLANR